MLLYVARGQCWSVFLLTVLLLLLVTMLITLCSFLARHSLNDPAARSDECLGQQTRCRSKRQWLSEGWQGAYCSCWNRTGGRNEEFMLLIRGQLIIPLLLRCCLLLLLLLATDDACSSFFFIAYEVIGSMLQQVFFLLFHFLVPDGRHQRRYPLQHHSVPQAIKSGDAGGFRSVAQTSNSSPINHP